MRSCKRDTSRHTQYIGSFEQRIQTNIKEAAWNQERGECPIIKCPSRTCTNADKTAHAMNVEDSNHLSLLHRSILIIPIANSRETGSFHPFAEKPVLLFMLSNALAEISSPLQDFINPDSIERRDAGKQNEICIPGIGLEPAGNIHVETPMETCSTPLRIIHRIQERRFS